MSQAGRTCFVQILQNKQRRRFALLEDIRLLVGILRRGGIFKKILAGGYV